MILYSSMEKLKILFLGYGIEETSLITFLQAQNFEVYHTRGKVTPEFVSSFDWIISFGYRYILKTKHLQAVNYNAINLHISYLPYNKGSHPNYWSFIDNTPTGVTIHQIDEGLDTGPIYTQKELELDITVHTFKSSYSILLDTIEKLFKENIHSILSKTLQPKKQKGAGTHHRLKDLPEDITTWDINIKKYLEQQTMTDLQIIDAVEAVRTKNNKNWMDILRVAFKHAPEEARPILAEINKSDSEISRLLDKLANNG